MSLPRGGAFTRPLLQHDHRYHLYLAVNPLSKPGVGPPERAFRNLASHWVTLQELVTRVCPNMLSCLSWVCSKSHHLKSLSKLRCSCWEPALLGLLECCTTGRCEGRCSPTAMRRAFVRAKVCCPPACPLLHHDGLQCVCTCVCTHVCMCAHDV